MFQETFMSVNWCMSRLTIDNLLPLYFRLPFMSVDRITIDDLRSASLNSCRHQRKGNLALLNMSSTKKE